MGLVATKRVHPNPSISIKQGAAKIPVEPNTPNTPRFLIALSAFRASSSDIELPFDAQTNTLYRYISLTLPKCPARVPRVILFSRGDISAMSWAQARCLWRTRFSGNRAQNGPTEEGIMPGCDAVGAPPYQDEGLSQFLVLCQTKGTPGIHVVALFPP
jgi:hypothetical protein